MNLDFLSGLLLVTVVVATVAFVVKEMLDNGGPADGNMRSRLSRLRDMMPGRDAEPINNHLIGATGEVISHSGDGARPMRVRIHPELWSARRESPAADSFPIGTTVRVVAVDGNVLVVTASDDAGAPPGVG